MVRHLLTDPVLPAELLPAGLARERDCARLRTSSPPNWRRGATRTESVDQQMSDAVRVERNGAGHHGDPEPAAGAQRRQRPDGRRAVSRRSTNSTADDTASVAVLWGEHGTFCAGADLKAFGTPDANQTHRTGPGPMGPTRMVLSKPVIAAVSGYAVAGGLELALWCDLRVVEDDAVFGVFCRRWGVPLIDGGTVRLPRLIGHSRAMDMILTGRGGGRRRGAGDRAGQPGGAHRRGAPGGRAAGRRTGRVAPGVPARGSALGAAAVGDDRSRTRWIRNSPASRRWPGRRWRGGPVRRRAPADTAQSLTQPSSASAPSLMVLPDPRLSTFGSPSL